MDLNELANFIVETVENNYIFDMPSFLVERLKLISTDYSFRKYAYTFKFRQNNLPDCIVQIEQINFRHREAIINITYGNKEYMIRANSKVDPRKKEK